MKDSIKNILKTVSAISLTAIMTVSAYATGNYYSTGDLDGDGQITSSDALLILQKTTGLIENFPVEEETVTGLLSAEVSTDDCSIVLCDGDTVTCDAKLLYPVVTVPNNPVASASINKVLEQVRVSDEVLNELAQATIDGIEGGYISGSYSSYYVDYEVKTNDKILSIVVYSDEFYSTAIHGYHWNTAFNFDLETGALITQPMMFENSDDFKTYASEYIYNQISDYALVEYSYDVYEQIRDDNWYLENGNYKIFFNPYEVAPYAAGIVEVEIPDYKSYCKPEYDILTNGG